jgi:hypothetical protein
MTHGLQLTTILVTGGAGFTRPHRQRARLYYTYILESLKDRKLYIGWTDDIEKRIGEHKKRESIFN